MIFRREKHDPRPDARAEQAHGRLERLYEISKLFASFENVEQTFEPALGIVAKTMPLRTAILIETYDGHSKMYVWPSGGDESFEHVRAAKEHAEATYKYLIGAPSTEPLDLVEKSGVTALPRQPEAEIKGEAANRFIVIPLVVAHRPPFGVLQVEGARPLDKADLMFVNAIGNQLATALDRDRAWRRDIARREHAEEGRTYAEAKGATAERERVIAQTSREKYEALAVENARLYEEARQSVRVREQILAIVSHDLKSPLGAILMTTDTLVKRAATDERRQGSSQAVARIQRAAERMLRLIEDLLDFASIEAGHLAIKREAEDAASMVHEAMAAFDGVAKEKGLRLTAQVDPQLPKVYCDRERILQVLSNLIGNATKVMAQGGLLAMRVEVRERELLFAVSDTGPGISAEDLKHLFERYWRSIAAGYKGTGLGLPISRGIIDAHGGRIWPESEVGRGTTFFFTVPIADAAAMWAGERRVTRTVSSHG